MEILLEKDVGIDFYDFLGWTNVLIGNVRFFGGMVM